jgi:hypothetical protein
LRRRQRGAVRTAEERVKKSSGPYPYARACFTLGGMADVWVLLLIVAFFAVCVAFVRGCDRIIGSDDSIELGTPAPSETEAREAETVTAGR